jgi:hypothetical protein
MLTVAARRQVVRDNAGLAGTCQKITTVLALTAIDAQLRALRAMELDRVAVHGDRATAWTRASAVSDKGEVGVRRVGGRWLIDVWRQTA